MSRCLKINNNRYLPEAFYVFLLGFDAILKRVSLKDCVHFHQHNPFIPISSDLFSTAVCFNLFSKYGIGKQLEKLLYELFKTAKIGIDIHTDNIFVKEILNLSDDILPLIRRANSNEKKLYSYNYGIFCLNKVDDISHERINRLSSLFTNNDDFSSTSVSQSNEQKNNLNDEEIQVEYCSCRFCNKFRKYNYPKDEDIEVIILNVLKEIDNKIIELE